MFSQIKMYLAKVNLEQDTQFLLFFLICKMCGALEDIKNGCGKDRRSSADKMHCSHLIKRRGEIRPVDAIFSPENRFDYLYTRCCAEQHADKQQRKQSLCLPLWSPLSFLISVQPLSRSRHLMTHIAGLLPFH